MRLLCFPYAGGAPSAFFGWPELLAPEVEVIWIQSRGRGARFLETPLNHVSEMVQEIAAALTTLDDRPFCFYGHSLGALVAFEVARLLRRNGQRGPAHLFVGAARAPQLERILPPLGHLPDKAFIDAIQSRYSGIPAAILDDPEMMQLFLPTLRADFAAYEGYRYVEERLLACPITTFVGAHDPVVTAEAMAAWAEHSSAPFTAHTLPGDHFFLASCRDRLVHTVRHALLNSLSDRDDRNEDFVPTVEDEIWA
ncbi:thioesterase II family protein [Acidicapsa ligni]|uniref:thioesterase II family protein n=1 Tax=Acidicapsa ligni TaxID=542300 RepID=UPI0021DF554E|nr:alpha/beta fold hydrolase [Acidicapsa ligni]